MARAHQAAREMGRHKSHKAYRSHGDNGHGGEHSGKRKDAKACAFEVMLRKVAR